MVMVVLMAVMFVVIMIVAVLGNPGLMGMLRVGVGLVGLGVIVHVGVRVCVLVTVPM